jgi:SAM-dependent methyltransferase
MNVPTLDKIKHLISSKLSYGSIWPPIDYELEDVRSQGRLCGRVLNAGCGWRDISHLVDGELVNQDLRWPDDSRINVDIFSPLHQIPVCDNYFDTILCIAVLEHVINPVEVVKELARVLKPGGLLVVSVPFMQPEHKVPADYQRYTCDGVEVLLKSQGLSVLESKPIFTVYHTLYWIADEWLQLKTTMPYRIARMLILPVLAFRANRSSTTSEKIASAFRALAIKPSG